MTEQINNTKNKIRMTKEKIYNAESIINVVHYYTNINNDDSPLQMIDDIIEHCKQLKQ